MTHEHVTHAGREGMDAPEKPAKPARSTNEESREIHNSLSELQDCLEELCKIVQDVAPMSGPGYEDAWGAGRGVDSALSALGHGVLLCRRIRDSVRVAFNSPPRDRAAAFEAPLPPAERATDPDEREVRLGDARNAIAKAVAVYDANIVTGYPLSMLQESFDECRTRLIDALGCVAHVRHHEDSHLCSVEERTLEIAMQRISRVHFSFEHMIETLVGAGVLVAFTDDAGAQS